MSLRVVNGALSLWSRDVFAGAGLSNYNLGLEFALGEVLHKRG